MDYIAIGVYESDPPLAEEELSSLAIKQDLQLVYQSRYTDDIDLEVIEGVREFAAAKQLRLYQIIRLSTAKKIKTSSGVNQDLVDFFLQKKARPDLVDFLAAAKEQLPEEYHLIFAFDWRSNERLRYEEFDVSELEAYFLKNNTWYLWLYDMHRNIYEPDFDTPFVMKIKSGRNEKQQ